MWAQIILITWKMWDKVVIDYKLIVYQTIMSEVSAGLIVPLVYAGMIYKIPDK